MKLMVVKYIFCILILLTVSGCATRKEIVRFKEDTSYLRLQLEMLRNENKVLKKIMTDLNKNLTNIQDESRQTKADILAEMENIKNQSLILDSKLDEQAYRPYNDQKKTQTVELEENASDSDSLNEKQQSTASYSQNKKLANPNELYNSAYMDISRGNYKMAIRGFQEFLYNFPEHDLSDNAQYWIGEACYAQKNYEGAIEEFEKVVNNYPKGDKIAAAILKIGYSYKNLQFLDIAKNYLLMVVERYPHTEEARLAQAWLSSKN